MAVMTMSAGPSSLNPASPRPHVSSPLASGGLRRPHGSSPLASEGVPRPPRNVTKTLSFPTSRPLRPFPSIANSVHGVPARTGSSSSKKPIKIIEPPANLKCAFVLNLTQAEFRREF